MHQHPLETPHKGENNIPKGRSIAHPLFRDNKVAFLSFDIETGGEHCGILQLSAEIVRFELAPTTTSKGVVSTTNDTAVNVRRGPTTFNSYVNPGEGAIYAEHASSVHGLNASHPSIREADEIFAVWHRFCEWIRTNVPLDESIVLVAYNGATCDLKWLWRMTQLLLALRANVSFSNFEIDYALTILRVPI